MSEVVYDAQIAPVLMDVAALCERHGIPFLALVEYEPKKLSRTEFLGENPCLEMMLARWAARSRGNVDSLIIQIMKYAREHGHSSVCLKTLGL